MGVGARIEWPTGYVQNTAKDNWAPNCGDGLRYDTEKWDDGNKSSWDGCKGDWTAIESWFVWSRGTNTSKDTCIKWGRGFYQNDSSNPTRWVSIWGDGVRAGTKHVMMEIQYLEMDVLQIDH